MKETVAVADLIPEDVVLGVGVVVGYPYSVPGLPGSLVPMRRASMGMKIEVDWYYKNPNMLVDIIR